MKIKQTYLKNYLLIFIYSLGLISCVEEFKFENENFEDILVVDATITNELKHQEVLLSRTFRFEDEPDVPETNAIVALVSENITIPFSEIEPGQYISDEEFKAQPNTTYRLEINTAAGKSYISETTELTQETQIDALYAEREVNGSQGDGVSLFVDSYDPTGNAKYFRYNFEETYKIIAPFWVSKKAVVIANDWPNCEVELVARPDSVRVCYNTQRSEIISVTSTSFFSENRVERHRVNFLSNQNAKISYRYSLLAIQYVQTEEANNYYKALLQFNANGSLFSQIQGGYLKSNYRSMSNENEKVIGFFEVASVSKKRIFFNYDDFYPDEPLPPYFVDCFESSPKLTVFGLTRCGALPKLIESKAIAYLTDNEGQFEMGGPYIMVPRICGYCTVIGEASPPDFWIE